MKKLGFGTMRLPLLEEGHPERIDLERFCEMADRFLDRGFTYFDTAYPYHEGQSEIAVRECVAKRYDRERFVLADKMPVFQVNRPEDYQKIFDEQLKKCGVEYFDYYLLHNLGCDRYAKTEELGGFDFLARVKESGHALDRILTEHPEVDFVQLQINYLDWESAVAQSRLCYETAVKHGKPVVVMEPVKGGTLANLPERAMRVMKQGKVQQGKEEQSGARQMEGKQPKAQQMELQHLKEGAETGIVAENACSPASYAVRYAASLEHVFMVLSGMSDMAQLTDNTSYMQDFRPLDEGEREMLNEVTGILNETIDIPCTGCRYCMEVCPKNINIPAYFGLTNLYKVTGKKTNMYYQRFSMDHGRASECIRCGRCEGNCPQHIGIREKLEEFAALYEGQN